MSDRVLSRYLAIQHAKNWMHLVFDLQGTCIDGNANALALFGVDANAIKKQSLKTLFQFNADTVSNAFDLAISTSTAQAIELKSDKKNFTGEFIPVNTGDAFTEVVLVLQQTLAHEHNDQKELLRVLLSRISHDLKGPLRAIDSYMTLLAKEYTADGQNENAQALLGRMAGALTSARVIIDGLQELAVLDAVELKYTSIDLTLLFDWIYSELDVKYPGRHFSVDIHTDVELKADERLMKKLFSHLLDNAFRFSAENTSINVSVSKSEDRVIIAIHDQGIGYDSTYQHKLFLPFETLHTRDEKAQAGLGLAIAKKITDLLGGEISSSSQINSGSVFTVQLPMA